MDVERGPCAAAGHGLDVADGQVGPGQDNRTLDTAAATRAYRGRLLTHRMLLTEVWGPQYADDTRVLRTHVANLRRKIEPQGARRYIRTDPGVGYRFAA